MRLQCDYLTEPLHKEKGTGSYPSWDRKILMSSNREMSAYALGEQHPDVFLCVYELCTDL